MSIGITRDAAMLGHLVQLFVDHVADMSLVEILNEISDDGLLAYLLEAG